MLQTGFALSLDAPAGFDLSALGVGYIKREKKKLIGTLQMLCFGAEMFPRGNRCRCWQLSACSAPSLQQLPVLGDLPAKSGLATNLGSRGTG